MFGPRAHLFFFRSKALHNIFVHLFRNNFHKFFIVGLFNDAVSQNKSFYPLNLARTSDFFQYSLNELIFSGIKNARCLRLFVTVIDVDVNLIIYVVIYVYVDVYVLFVLRLKWSEVPKCQIGDFFGCHHLVSFVYVTFCHRFIHLRCRKESLEHNLFAKWFINKIIIQIYIKYIIFGVLMPSNEHNHFLLLQNTVFRIHCFEFFEIYLYILQEQMGKHRHSKDKMHITYTEMKEDWQGKKTIKRIPFEKLPYFCCALSLAPFQNPVCTPDGNVFDFLYIMPFIKKFHRCPITGAPLKASDLIKMHWTKNEKEEYQDPISYKVFTENTHIVCIKTSGHVYAYQTILELNKKERFYFDLITNDPFTPADIINIQDPKNEKNKQVADFDYLKNNLPFIPPEKLQPSIKENETINRVMQQVTLKRQANQELKEEETKLKKKQKLQLESRQDVKGFLKYCIQHKIYQHQRQTDLVNSTSLTSTNFSPHAKGFTSFRDLKQSQIREKLYTIVRDKKWKGNIVMTTNIGNFTFLIHADLVPKTSENFIQLSENGYYDGLTFHRLVKDFCLQGGDPTGTGSGGQSIFGKPFEDEFNPKLTHNKPGILSMANSGPMTNGSQFFITLEEAPYLNNKHSVFGEIISSDSMNILYEINRNLTSKTNKPKKDIIIEKMHVYQNPFRKAIKVLRDEGVKAKNHEKVTAMKQKERWIEEDTNKFKLPEAKDHEVQEGSISSHILSDYF